MVHLLMLENLGSKVKSNRIRGQTFNWLNRHDLSPQDFKPQPPCPGYGAGLKHPRDREQG